MTDQVPSKRFSRVHAVCCRLRDKPCKLCPARYRHQYYGWMVYGCYGLAAELINIVKTGNPWGKKASKKSVRAWRKRFNRE